MKEIIRKHGLKATNGRVEVLKYLEKNRGPISAEEMYGEIPRSICSSLSTIYRILNQLTEVGLLRASLEQNGVTYYEYAGEGHRHYIVCESCGELTPIDNCPLEVLDEHIRSTTGYKITGHIFKMKGICKNCQGK